ncbi:MAG: nitroreductase [Frankiales bacterium]|nr:nitroreductase [Frankiales bacterium]
MRDEVELYALTGAGRDGRPVVVLETTGAVTGLTRRTPLMRVEHAGTYAAVASMAGSATHPRWYLNALKNPDVRVYDGPLAHDLRAREVVGEERARWWSRANGVFPSYADYQSKTRRPIPVLLLEGPATG